MSAEPQSIVHSILRASSKLCRPKDGRRRRLPIAKRSSCRTSTLQGDDRSVTTDTSSGSTSKHETLGDLSSSELILSPSRTTDESSVVEQYGYRRLDQNDLLGTLTRRDEDDSLWFVHFYIRESYFSDNLHKQMIKLAESKPDRRFFCTEKRLCPFITAKLGITSKNPAVVAIRRGKVLNKIAEFSSVDCSELKNWVDTVELLSLVHQ